MSLLEDLFCIACNEDPEQAQEPKTPAKQGWFHRLLATFTQSSQPQATPQQPEKTFTPSGYILSETQDSLTMLTICYDAYVPSLQKAAQNILENKAHDTPSAVLGAATRLIRAPAFNTINDKTILDRSYFNSLRHFADAILSNQQQSTLDEPTIYAAQRFIQSFPDRQHILTSIAAPTSDEFAPPYN